MHTQAKCRTLLHSHWEGLFYTRFAHNAKCSVHHVDRDHTHAATDRTHEHREREGEIILYSRILWRGGDHVRHVSLRMVFFTQDDLLTTESTRPWRLAST